MRMMSATLGAMLVSLVPSAGMSPAIAQSSPEGVEGKIGAVSTNGQLVQLNVGSAKLHIGDSVHVYGPGKLQQYRGKVVVTTVTAKESVGRFQPARKSARVGSGDRVTDRAPPKM